MSKQLVLKIHNSQKELLAKEFDAKQSVHVKALDFVNYELIDANTGIAPENVFTARVGDNLLVSFDENQEKFSLIIDDYFNAKGEHLIGKSFDGKYHFYDQSPESSYYLKSSCIEEINEHTLTEKAQDLPLVDKNLDLIPWVFTSLGAVAAIGTLAGITHDVNKQNNSTPVKKATESDNHENTNTDKQDTTDKGEPDFDYKVESEFKGTNGDGDDVLTFKSMSGSINLDPSKIHNFEVFDLADDKAQTITLSAKDVLQMTDSDNVLFIKGNNDDTVKLDEAGQWNLQKASDKADYDMYVSVDNVTLYIETDVQTVIL